MLSPNPHLPLTTDQPMTDLLADGEAPTPAPVDHGTSLPPEGLERGGEATTGPEPASGTDRPEADRLAPFAPAILAVRWASSGVSLALASPDLLDGDLWVLAWVALVLLNTVARTVRPLQDRGRPRHLVALLAEIGLHVMAVIATGYWDSPIVLILINSVIIAGFARGFAFALRVAGASTLAVTVPGLTDPWGPEHLARSAQWTTLLALGGIVAGYTRRITGEASRRHHQALDRVSRLSDANALLNELHRVTQTLPASLDQAEVLESTIARLRTLISFDAGAILLADDQGQQLTVACHQGGVRTDLVLPRDLPTPAVLALQLQRLQGANELRAFHRPLTTRSRAGLYVPLLARGRLVGLLLIETSDPKGYSTRDRQLVKGFVEPVALAIDNARLFNRIRTVGADEERTRIARDLHDRVGQSLAYFGFEIDRIIRLEAAGEALAPQLQALRGNLRSVVVEVRDTLADLRTMVSDSRDFSATAADFAARLTERSELEVELDCSADQRLPILQEREMWRIAQEALVNVERHAQASHATLRWRCSETGALLEVADDGRGLPEPDPSGHRGRSDSFGIIGMQERAESMGAEFEITSKPGEGTKVRCFLPQR